jgi:hypothetical protein
MRKVLAVLVAMSWPLSAAAQVQTTITPTLPSLGTVDKDPNDPDATYCRPPQAQTDSRLAGPTTCRTNRVWNELHAQGLDIGPDGQSVVASEKYRRLHGQ